MASGAEDKDQVDRLEHTTGVCVCVCACAYMCVYVCVHTCVCVRVRAYLRVRRCEWVSDGRSI